RMLVRDSMNSISPRRYRADASVKMITSLLPLNINNPRGNSPSQLFTEQAYDPRPAASLMAREPHRASGVRDGEDGEIGDARDYSEAPRQQGIRRPPHDAPGGGQPDRPYPCDGR